MLVGGAGVSWRQEMVKMRHATEIRDVNFSAPVGLPPGLEVMTLADLRERAARRMGADFLRPQRPHFHHLVAVRRGRLRQTVDFAGYDLGPGAWLWVRPGQVHQWGDLTSADGTLIIFEQGFLDPATRAHIKDPHGVVVRAPAEADKRALRAATMALDREFRASGRLPLETHQAILRHLLSVVVLNLSQLGALPGGPAPHATEIFLRFRDAVETHFASARRLEDYATFLGYSTRTLSRASMDATGVGGKEYIDRRVLLEAKRLLAHADQPAAKIAARLGFSSATNFSKFFHQRTDTSPLAFRRAVRGTAT
jgi:AraC-like DNA-binding protein